jgi:dolichyl-phosphate-mannose--protein O-mannosyl transferase
VEIRSWSFVVHATCMEVRRHVQEWYEWCYIDGTNFSFGFSISRRCVRTRIEKTFHLITNFMKWSVIILFSIIILKEFDFVFKSCFNVSSKLKKSGISLRFCVKWKSP